MSLIYEFSLNISDSGLSGNPSLVEWTKGDAPKSSKETNNPRNGTTIGFFNVLLHTTRLLSGSCNLDLLLRIWVSSLHLLSRGKLLWWRSHVWVVVLGLSSLHWRLLHDWLSVHGLLVLLLRLTVRNLSHLWIGLVLATWRYLIRLLLRRHHWLFFGVHSYIFLRYF